MIECMFDSEFGGWASPDGHPTLFRVDRQVWVNFQSLYPGLGKPMTGVPLWCRSGAARFEPWMEGRQLAWLRRFRRRMACLGTRTDQQLKWPCQADHEAVAGTYTFSRESTLQLGGTPRTRAGAVSARTRRAPGALASLDLNARAAHRCLMPSDAP